MKNEAMMNCAEYGEAIAADPAENFAGGAAHAETCESCRGLRQGYRSFDARLHTALAVSVPPLAMPELVDDNVVALPRRRWMTQPAWFGMAAGIALAAYFSLQLLSPDTSGIALADQVIAHLDHEAYSRVVTDVAVSERTLDSVVSNDVAELGPGIGLITYARSCIINGKAIPHLVVQGENGPVTLLMMPDEPIERAITLQGESINGVILPVGGGSIAIVGEREERIDEIGNRVVDSVKWKT